MEDTSVSLLAMPPCPRPAGGPLGVTLGPQDSPGRASWLPTTLSLHSPQPLVGLFAVYDGHGGAAASEYLRLRLHRAFVEHLTKHNSAALLPGLCASFLAP